MDKPKDESSASFLLIAQVFAGSALWAAMGFTWYTPALAALVFLILAIVSRFRYNRRVIRYLKIVCCVALLACVGCSETPHRVIHATHEEAPVSDGQHSVLVLPPAVEKRIADLEAARVVQREINDKAEKCIAGVVTNCETLDRKLESLDAKVAGLKEVAVRTLDFLDRLLTVVEEMKRQAEPTKPAPPLPVQHRTCCK